MLLNDEIEGQIIDEPDEWLILGPHPEFEGYWEVNCLNSTFFFDFEEIIGAYRAVSPKNYEEFKEAAEAHGYKLVFIEDPSDMFAQYEQRKDTPDVQINSPFDNTINGFLPHQAEGYNLLKNKRASMAVWGTGTGKTVLAAALIRRKVVDGDFDLAIMPVRKHNKISAQRKLLQLAGVESVVVSYGLDKRIDLYAQMYDDLEAGKPVTMITNYEKFLWDEQAFKYLVEDRNVLILWDEMSVKLGNRGTQLYNAVARVLYKSAELKDPTKKKKGTVIKWEEKRPNELMQVMMTANPIKRDPENVLNMVRIMDPDVFPTVKGFNNRYVQSWNYFNPYKPDKWKDLDHMGHKLDHMVHHVDKSDPEIAKYFPEAIEEVFPIEWNDRTLYDNVQATLEEGIKEDDSNILPMLMVLQMLCDAPSMLVKSAADRAEFEELLASFSEGFGDGAPKLKGSELALQLVEALGNHKDLPDDQDHAKVQTLKYHLTEGYPNDKALVFSTFNRLFLPTASEWLTEWGVSHVVYTGTEKQKQEVLDAFKNDDSIQGFLSSDSGADSLDIEEASLVINYNFPWEYLTLNQRQNRTSRVTSTHAYLRWLSYVMQDSFEDRKVKKIVQKKGYEQTIFSKGAFTMPSRMTREDQIEMLTGRRDAD